MPRNHLGLLILLLIFLLVPGGFCSQEVHVGPLSPRKMEITGITLSFEGPGILRLTALLSEDFPAECRVTWRLNQPSRGYALKSTEGPSVLATIGDLQGRVTVEACLSGESGTGGCAEIKLTADVLDQAQDVAAYEEIELWDYSEPRFVCVAVNDDQYQFVFYDVASRVNTVTGEYLRDQEDLGVKVPGGRLTVHRWYQGGMWSWEHERHDLTPVFGPEGAITAIQKGGAPYRPVPGEKGVFSEGFFRIETTETGFRWESKDGQWKRYNAEGRLTAFGDRSGVIGRILFRKGRPFCLSDRNNDPVLWLTHDQEGRLRTVYDRTGRGVTYRYRSGRLSAVTDPLGKETRFAYDDEGRLAEALSPQGAKTLITYNDLGRVASILDEKGEGHRFTWDVDRKTSLYYVRIEAPSGKRTEIWSNKKGQARRVDMNGRTVHRIEKQGSTLIVTDARGLITRKTFDKRGNLLEVVHPDGSFVKKEYEPRFNRPVKTIDENGVETRLAYDGKGRLIQKKEAVGTPSERITEHSYDGDGNLLSTTQVGDERTPEAVTRHTYDAAGNRIATTGPEGHTTSYTYDTQGNVLTRTDPTGAVWRYAYDLAGRLTGTKDPLGRETRLFYDAEGRKIREIDPRGNETRYAYDGKGNLTRLTDALGNATEFAYNPDGRLTRRIDAEGLETSYAYDTEGRMVSLVDGAGNETRMVYETPFSGACPTCGSGEGDKPDRIVYPTFEKKFCYDRRGRKVEETDVLNETEAYTTLLEYDPAGNLISKTDKKGRTTAYAYDALNRLIRVTDPMGNETHYVYDDRDNLIQLTDAKGQTTRFAYDRNNRMVRETRPMGQETVYAYTGAGQLAEKTDAKGQRTVYTYDAAGQLITTRYFTGPNATEPVKTVTFVRDEAGNLLTYDDGVTSAQYTYDALSRKTQETVDYGPFSKTFTYAYYGNAKKRSFTGPDGITYAYAYDDADRLTAIDAPKLGTITYTDYQWMRPSTITLPGGTTRNFAYDSLMRIHRIASLDPKGGTILDYQYAYDPMDNILTKETEHGTYHYGYDPLDQLIEAQNPTLPDEAFTYDPVGNRLTSKGVEGVWSYNTNNELMHYDGISFGYDANGNTIEKVTPSGVSRYGYNAEDRMSRVEDGAGNLIATYFYDPFGRRLWKEVAGKRVYFLYSDEGLIAEYDDTGREIKTYGYKPGSTWTTDPVFMKEGKEYYFYHNDHLGTPQKMTTTKGNVVWSARHEAFGKAEIYTASILLNNLRFPGHYSDFETGYYYNLYRFYSPTKGRYSNIDPIKRFSGSNYYIYCSNNSIIKYDMLGLRENNITDLIDPIMTPIQIHAFRRHMRSYFKFQYNDGLEECNKLYKLGNNFCFEMSTAITNFCIPNCFKKIDNFYESCKNRIEGWSKLYDDYGYLDAFSDSWKYTERETLEHYIQQLGTDYSELKTLLFIYITKKSI